MHLSMLSPRGKPRAFVGHLITFAISTVGNLTESLGPRVGTFDTFGEEDWALMACCLKAAILKREEWHAVVVFRYIIKDKNEQRI